MDDGNFSERESTPDDLIGPLLGMVARHRWWIFGPAFLVPLVAIAVVMYLPDQYTSEATLVVVQQQVSQRYVDPTNTISPADAVNSMTREVLSRPRLLAIIDSFGLYPKLKGKAQPDQLTDRIREDITVEPLDKLPGRNDFTAFQVAFTADNPRLAQEVASRLTQIFIEENLKVQGNQASTTAKFLAEQLAAAKQRLTEQEQRLSDFKAKNLSELPQQEQSNLSTLTDLRIQLQNNSANQSRAQQQRTSLEYTLNGSLARLQSERSALLARFTLKHPEVVRKDTEIERLQNLLAEVKTGTVAIDKTQDQAGVDDPMIAQIKGQVEANRIDLENLTREEQRLRLEITQYQGRLRLTPMREQQLTGVLRDYELYKQDYTELLNKQLRSQLTANLEEQQSGQNFRLVDPPTLPTLPSGPKRVKISLGAAGAGIALGLALAFLMNLRDSSFHTEKEVQWYFKPPLFVAVPVLVTPAEERWKKWRLVIEWAAGVTMLAIVVAAEVYVFLRSSPAAW